MDEFLIFLVLPGALVLFIFAGAIAAFVALARIRRLGEQVTRLERQLLAGGGVPTPGAPLAGPRTAATMPAERSASRRIDDEPVADDPPPAPPAPPDTDTREQPAAQPSVPATPHTPRPVLSATSNLEGSFEEIFTGRWLVWLGGVTLALGGFFLVKYSIDQGWIGPLVRVLAGLALGLALIGGGEWLRRRPWERALAGVQPSYIPPALVAAGLATIFAALYAAYGLYDLIHVVVAFALLVATAAAAVLLALLHGWFVAVLGVVGAFAVPALLSTGQHSTEVLFPYIFVLIVGVLAVSRHTGWHWLNWLGLAGVVGYTCIWYATWQSGDALIVAPFLILTGVVTVLGRAPNRGPEIALPGPFDIYKLSRGEQFATGAALALALLVWALFRLEGGGLTALTTVTVAIALLLIEARRESRLDILALFALALALAVLLFWRMPHTVSRLAAMWELDGQAIGQVAGSFIPPELAVYVTLAAGFAALFGLGGFAALWGAWRPGYWASLSAIPPVLFLAVAYLRIERFEIDLGWALVAVLLAALLAFAGERVARFRAHAGMRAALGAYAIGASAGLVVAFAVSLENAWLTVALSLQVAAMVWIDEKLDLRAVRRAAEALAYVVAVRLLLNPEIFDYRLGAIPGLNWLLYGYGVPMAAFWWASRRPGARHDPRLGHVLEAGALLFLVVLASLEIRHLIAGGGVDHFDYRLAEQSLNTIAWAGIAYALYHRLGPASRLVQRWGWRLLAGLAFSHAVVMQLGFSNPLLSDDGVGPWPIFNLLLLGFGGPMLFALLFLRRARARGDMLYAAVAGLTGLVFGFFWLTLEVRHAFQGSEIGAWRSTGDGEWYAYSLAWLAFAGVLLGLAILRGYRAARYASLVVVMFTVAKVFLFDMAALTGIFRALSFIALGLVLVSVGYLYRRFVFPPKPPLLEEEGDDA